MSAEKLVQKNPDSLPATEFQRTFPAVLARAGKAVCFAVDEFFRARLSNPHTRTAYVHQVGRFLAWCEEEGLEFHQVTPGLAGRFLDELPYKAASNTCPKSRSVSRTGFDFGRPSTLHQNLDSLARTHIAVTRLYLLMSRVINPSPLRK